MSCPPVFLENKNRPETSVSGLFGGDKRDRTADLLNAIQALSPYKRVANPLKGGGESAFGTQKYLMTLDSQSPG